MAAAELGLKGKVRLIQNNPEREGGEQVDETCRTVGEHFTFLSDALGPVNLTF